MLPFLMQGLNINTYTNFQKTLYVMSGVRNQLVGLAATLLVTTCSRVF